MHSYIPVVDDVVYELINIYSYTLVYMYSYIPEKKQQEYQKMLDEWVLIMLDYGYIRFIYQYTIPYCKFTFQV